MAQRELQSVANRVGVPATLDREELVEALTHELGLGDE